MVQINPEEPGASRSRLEIVDRRNELSGNLSLYQELRVIEKIDQLLDQGVLVAGGAEQVTVRIIALPRQRSTRWLGPASKLNRDGRFLRDLMTEGERHADSFLTTLAFEQAWRRVDTTELMHCLSDDAELTSTNPFPVRGPVRGRQLHQVIRELASDVRMDLTRKQLTREKATWSVRVDEEGATRRGLISAEFQDNRITRVHLGPLTTEGRGDPEPAPARSDSP